jgi:hypothetical protein
VRETIDNWRVQGDIIDRYFSFLRFNLFLQQQDMLCIIYSRYVRTLVELIGNSLQWNI